MWQLVADIDIVLQLSVTFHEVKVPSMNLDYVKPNVFLVSDTPINSAVSVWRGEADELRLQGARDARQRKKKSKAADVSDWTVRNGAEESAPGFCTAQRRLHAYRR